MIIESTANPFVKQIKKLKDKKNRREEGKYLIEGVNLCREFLSYMPHLADSIIATKDKANLADGFENVYVVSEKVFAVLSDTQSPQGLMVVGRMPEENIDGSKMQMVVYLDQVADPGNVGTIIRTADAFGADAVLLSPNCADLYNPKTVRSTMGSMFHIPVVYEENYLNGVQKCQDAGFQILTGSLDAVKAPQEIDFVHRKTLICLGNEAHGVSEELVSLGVEKVKIPMPGKAESLNVAAAGAVLMYEAVRQKGA